MIKHAPRHLWVTKMLFFVLCLSLTLGGFVPSTQAAGFQLKPTASAFAKSFIQQSEGQQWFIDEIERLLNIQEKSLNTIRKQDDLNSIVTLGLYNKGISGKIPKAIGHLQQLRYLFLGKNKLQGEIPKELFTLKQLETLDLSENQLTGPLSSEVGALSNLRVLLLWSNQLQGSIPEALGTLTKLENVDLAQNQFTGKVPDLTELSQLKLLALSHNPLAEQPLPIFGETQKKLRVLLLWNSHFIGTIPASYGDLPELQILDVSHNQLTGGIPAPLGLLPQLMRLSASHNQLSGELPEGLMQWPELTTLDLGYNQFHGNLPADVNRLQKLEKLVLTNNQFSGKLPAIGEGQPALSYVDISHNKLVGDSPKALKSIQDADGIVDLSFNYMAGSVIGTMKQHEDNFVDSAANIQNQMVMKEYLQLEVDQPVDLYPLFRVVEAKTKQAKEKEKLPPSSYELRVLSPSNLTDEDIEIHMTDQGIPVKLLKEVPYQEPITLELRIRHNEGSNYSKTVFTMGTEAAPSSGGGGGSVGGGGGTLPTPEPVVPDEQHTAYIQGYSDGTVRPSASITRQEAAMMLYRLSDGVGNKELLTPDRLFPDVSTAQWSAEAIAYVKQAGMMEGRPDGKFDPHAPLTRAEVATLLARYKSLAKEPSVRYKDVTLHWAKAAIAKVTEAGWMEGYPNGTFKPSGAITRAEFIVTMNRVLERKPDVDYIVQMYTNPYRDIQPSHWAYPHVIEATATHAYAKGTDHEVWLSIPKSK